MAATAALCAPWSARCKPKVQRALEPTIVPTHSVDSTTAVAICWAVAGTSSETGPQDPGPCQASSRTSSRNRPDKAAASELDPASKATHSGAINQRSAGEFKPSSNKAMQAMVMKSAALRPSRAA